MISYFPDFYPDELVYSLLARYVAHSGYTNYIFAAEDLFHRRWGVPDIEFVNPYTDDAFSCMTRKMPMEEIVLKHTMYPAYGRFLPLKRRLDAFTALCSQEGNIYDLMPIQTRSGSAGRKLKFCPLCAKEDRERYGETYWHRMHQIQGISVCGKHGCYLRESEVQIGGRISPGLHAAEMHVPEAEAAICNNEVEASLAKYLVSVFSKEMDLAKETDIGAFLRSRLMGTPYLSARGGRKNIRLLVEEYEEFYREIDASRKMERWQIEKVLAGTRVHFDEICALSMFLGIPAEELVQMECTGQNDTAEFDEEIRWLKKLGWKYTKIATYMGISYDYAKHLGKRMGINKID